MSKSFLIYIVDDDPMILSTLESILEDDYSLELFESAEACLERINIEKPQMILLDVSLPGMDGYTLCQQLKAQHETRDISITFISAHDTLEARLNGYEAGGEDFVVKPFEVAEIRSKAQVAEKRRAEKALATEQVQSAEQLTELLMASMNDYVALVSYLGKMAGCTDAVEVAEASLQLLRNFMLEGVVQIRLKSGDLTMSAAGTNVPLEISIMNHVRTMERIFEFKQRSVYNFEHVTIMVNNMPLHDSEACGRIRDNLAIAAQGADARLQGIEAVADNQLKQEGIHSLLKRVADSVGTIRELQRKNQLQGAEIAFQLQEDMAKAFVHLGLSNGQERFIEEMIRDNADRLLSVLKNGEQVQGILERLNEDLRQLSS